MDISFIVPFYKGNQYMEQLFGVLRRNAQNAPQLQIELVLVNDSPQLTIEYEDSWIEGFHLQVLENEVNCGIQRSRVKGLNNAQGTFVIFLDQDDLLSDNALASQFALSADQDVIVANGINENRDRRKPIYHSIAHQEQVAYPRFYYSVGCLIVSPGHCMIRKDKIPQVWYDSCVECNGADDYYLWLLMQGDCRWCINPEVLYTHVDTGKNLSSNLDQMLNSSCEVLDLLEKVNKITPQHNKIARRRFKMRKFYEGRAAWRKAVACLLHPVLFYELLAYTRLKKFCR
jgi:glycosyltransferase involved in cell wall biosynthesis